MSRHDPSISLRQMRDHAREATELVRGRKREDLDEERILALALVRLLEVVGEAATRVPPEARLAHPNIPWTQITGLRNRLIHAYDSVDLDIVWSILTTDLPPLVTALDAAIGALDPAD